MRNPDYSPYIPGLDPVNVEDFIDPVVHSNNVRSSLIGRPQQASRRSSLDYILELQESAEFEPTKGSRKRATIFADQVFDGSDTQTKIVYRGTNKYDPYSTQTSLTRKTTSSEKINRNERENTKESKPQESRRTISTNTGSQVKRPNSGRHARINKVDSRPSNESKVTSRNPNASNSQNANRQRKYNRNNTGNNLSTTLSPNIRSNSRVRNQGSIKPLTTITSRKNYSRFGDNIGRESKEDIEEENYPEEFKALLKSKSNKIVDTEKTVEQKNRPKSPTRSRYTTKERATTIAPRTKTLSTKNPKSVTRNQNSKLLFPTRKSTTKTTFPADPYLSYDDENLVEPTHSTGGFNVQVKYSGVQPVTQSILQKENSKSPFLAKNKSKAHGENYTLKTLVRQMSAPNDAGVTVSFVYNTLDNRFFFRDNLTINAFRLIHSNIILDIVQKDLNKVLDRKNPQFILLLYHH